MVRAYYMSCFYDFLEANLPGSALKPYATIKFMVMYHEQPNRRNTPKTTLIFFTENGM